MILLKILKRGVGVFSDGGLAFFMNFPVFFFQENSVCVTTHLMCVTSEFGLKYGLVSNLVRMYEFLCKKMP